MSQLNKLKVRNLTELQAPLASAVEVTEKQVNGKAPAKRIRKGVIGNPKTPSKCEKLSVLKDPSSKQTRIIDYFKSCPKKCCFEEIKSTATNETIIKSKSKRADRKRLFGAEKILMATYKVYKDIIIIESDDEKELKKDIRKVDLKDLNTNGNEATVSKSTSKSVNFSNRTSVKPNVAVKQSTNCKQQIKEKEMTSHAVNERILDAQLLTAQEMSSRKSNIGGGGLSSTYTSTPLPSDKTSKQSLSTLSKSFSSKSSRKLKACPPYKIVKGTTFAVDAFQYGYLDGVSHYFLTHFHADHYIGLTRKFSMPIYMSSLTARLVRAFISVQEHFLHILKLNEKVEINDWEITALDANHCPGAIMLFFKNSLSGKCLVHTGDFRACHQMESEPIFWNNVDIDALYLDTTYIAEKYAFCTQYESITQGKKLIQKFQENHPNKKILYVCGSYLVGKEKFWSALAYEYDLKVWSEKNRRKALEAMNEENLMRLLVDDPYQANMHILAMVKLSYLNLAEYFASYETHFDMILAIRPSGWEKNSRPQYRGKINIVGVEYSEHSSFEELKRFVKYLKPHQVISTVAMGRDPLITADVPQNWYKYQELKNSRSYQPIITSYMSVAKAQLRPHAIENKTKQARPKSLTEESSLAKENISKRDGIDKTSNVQELSTSGILRTGSNIKRTGNQATNGKPNFSEINALKLSKTERIRTSKRVGSFLKRREIDSKSSITKENILKQEEIKNSSNVQKLPKCGIFIMNPTSNESNSQTTVETISKFPPASRKRNFPKSTNNSSKYKHAYSQSLATNKNMSKPMSHAQKIPKKKICRSKSPSESSIPMAEESKEQDVLNVYKNGELKPPAPNDSSSERSKNFPECRHYKKIRYVEETIEKRKPELSSRAKIISEQDTFQVSLSSDEICVSQKRLLSNIEKQNSLLSKTELSTTAIVSTTQSLQWTQQVQLDLTNVAPKPLSDCLVATGDCDCEYDWMD
uniref:Lactamase_B domain-containing protein n=1 Tax=Glossina austeni TaxID=7395 RepID=A0A1A9VB50_GLOAU